MVALARAISLVGLYRLVNFGAVRECRAGDLLLRNQCVQGALDDLKRWRRLGCSPSHDPVTGDAACRVGCDRVIREIPQNCGLQFCDLPAIRHLAHMYGPKS